MEHRLVAFIFVGPFEMIYCNELTKRISEGVDTVDVHAKVQNAVEGITVVSARKTVDS